MGFAKKRIYNEDYIKYGFTSLFKGSDWMVGSGGFSRIWWKLVESRVTEWWNLVEFLTEWWNLVEMIYFGGIDWIVESDGISKNRLNGGPGGIFDWMVESGGIIVILKIDLGPTEWWNLVESLKIDWMVEPGGIWWNYRNTKDIFSLEVKRIVEYTYYLAVNLLIVLRIFYEIYMKTPEFTHKNTIIEQSVNLPWIFLTLTESSSLCH